jgi:putative cardiolipin synthase
MSRFAFLRCRRLNEVRPWWSRPQGCGPAPAHALLLLQTWLLAAMLLAGCSSLPQHVDRPLSNALRHHQTTPLGRWVEQQRPPQSGANWSGFQLLASPEYAYDSRLALIDASQRTLDVQYYAIHADPSTERLLRHMQAAAQRGVRVRILIDDLNVAGADAQILQLAQLPGIEIRLFNPLPGSHQSKLLRLLDALHDFDRMQRRMHNKIFVADNSLAIAGGRNLGAPYFGHGSKGNFVDLEVLAAGPVVQDLSRSFDLYWNNTLSYPVSALHDRETAGDAWANSTQPDGGNGIDFAEQARQLVWAPAWVMVDQPDKLAPGLAPDNAPSTIDGLIDLMQQARQDLLMVSPYFVPGPAMMKVFEQLRARGVRLRVLTNSLASNDAPIAHVGYARHRKALLAMGVELYEMRAELASNIRTLDSSRSQRASLHTKLMIMDGHLIVVGSMNLDGRSHWQNTEVALLVDSAELASQALGALKATLRTGTYWLRLEHDQLVWLAPPGMATPTGWGEPDASAPLQWLLKLIAPLAPDELL